jgi:hypothetical protein
MVSTPTPTNNPLQLLQAAFCLIKLGGDLLVVDRTDVAHALDGTKLGGVHFYKRLAGETLMKRYLENLPYQCDVKKTVADFWINPNTHVYTDIAFNPLPQLASTLNYWVGSLITPAAGNWVAIKNHLLGVICSGDTQIFEYLIKYLAHMLQYPHEKPGVMIVLLGKQGTGKGLFFQVLQRIWSRTSLLVSDVNQVVGQFNAALERHYVIIMDEALFSGDRKSQDRMKSLITETTCHIEQKYQPARTINSVHRFFASSNHNHFSHVEADDRRSLVIRVSDDYQGNLPYFNELGKEINDDQAIAAMVYDLLNIDLNKFNVRVRPLTQEHGNQKLLSLQGLNRYWYEVLAAGYFNIRYNTSAWSSPRFVATNTILESYQEFDKRSQKFVPTVSKDIADTLARLCPSAKKGRQKDNFGQHRGYELPDLATARKEFEAAYHCNIDWGNDDDDDDADATKDDQTSVNQFADAI